MPTKEIKRRRTGDIIYSGKHATLCEAVEAAVKARVCLDGASLNYARLDGARLDCASLNGASLDGASLNYARLDCASLDGASLDGASLKGASLDDASLDGACLTGAILTRARLARTQFGSSVRGADWEVTRADLYEVLVRARAEVPALLSALREGRVDGSTYEGDCKCLVGTIAAARGAPYATLSPDPFRPAERLFTSISSGDTPATNPISAMVVEWIEEWSGVAR